MEPRFLTPKQVDLLATGGAGRIVTTLAAYVPATWTGTNESGISPLGARVLVLPDVAEEQTTGGVHLPPDVAARNGMAAETGVLVALGEGAFAWSGDRIHPWVGRRPEPGDRVIIERYTGQLQRGLDGQIYRICEDRAIGAIATAPREEGETQ